MGQILCLRLFSLNISTNNCYFYYFLIDGYEAEIFILKALPTVIEIDLVTTSILEIFWRLICKKILIFFRQLSKSEDKEGSDKRAH